MKIMGAILLGLLICTLATSPDFRRTFAKSAGIIVAILGILWLWHAAGLWPFK